VSTCVIKWKASIFKRLYYRSSQTSNENIVPLWGEQSINYGMHRQHYFMTSRCQYWQWISECT